jgi:lipopolysaccharide transport system permease protein
VIVSFEQPTATVEAAPAARSSGDVGDDVDARPVVIIDGSAHWRRWWADLYHYRGALYSLAWRNVRSRYKQAGLGMLWAIIQPAVQVGVFTLLFGVIAKVPSGGVPYAVFALCGLLPWNAFAKILSDGAISLSANQALITKVFFPRIYLVLAAGASAILDALVGLALVAIAMVTFGVAPSPRLWLAIPALLGAMVLGFGLAALLAAVNARWRDVQHTIPFVLQIGLFLTPVLYRDSLLPASWRWIAGVNPLSGFIEIFRSSVLGVPLPDTRLLVTSFAVAIASIVVGAWYFTRVEASVVDVV